LLKNSQPFGKKYQKTSGDTFLTHTVYVYVRLFVYILVAFIIKNPIDLDLSDEIDPVQ